jgi:hypothetical protein
MKGGTDDLACPASMTFINIDPDGFNDFFLFFSRHGYLLLRLTSILNVF